MSNPYDAPNSGDQPDGAHGGGQPPYGSPQYGQPQYNQTQYNQAPYNQPQYGQQPHGQQPYGQQAPNNLLQQDSFWASAAHWGALVAGFLTSGLLPIVVPLVVMLTKGTTSPFVRRHAVESLNFQISMTIYLLVSIPLMFVLVGFFTALAVAIIWLVFTIVAAVKASGGEEYRYPLTIRMVS